AVTRAALACGTLAEWTPRHAVREPRRPPVDAARGRERRHELGHAEGDDEDEGGDDRPSPRDRDRAPVFPRLVVGREAAREDRDDRERDGEVLEAAPAAAQLLLV